MLLIATCAVGALDSGAHMTVAITVIPTDFRRGTTPTVTNAVAVTSNDIDPDLDNNTASETTEVVPVPAPTPTPFPPLTVIPDEEVKSADAGGGIVQVVHPNTSCVWVSVTATAVASGP